MTVWIYFSETCDGKSTNETTVQPRFNNIRFNVNFNAPDLPIFISILNDPRFNDSFPLFNYNFDELKSFLTFFS